MSFSVPCKYIVQRSSYLIVIVKDLYIIYCSFSDNCLFVFVSNSAFLSIIHIRLHGNYVFQVCMQFNW